MIERFEGKEGKRRLVEIFANQELVLHHSQLAQRLAEIAELTEYKKEQELYFQGEPGKNQLYFILSGKFEILAQGNHLAFKSAGEAVGEFPIVDPSLSYTVTIHALEDCVVAHVSEEQFLSTAHDYPEIWKNMSKMLVSRLRSTSESLPPPKSPCVFIGHGQSKLWGRLQLFLQDELGLQTVTYEKEARAGLSIVQILERMLR
jgi:hypothetical protein